MADTKVTRIRQDFPEVKDKIVDLVEFDIEPDFYGVTIRFQDKTALTFSMESSVLTFPVWEDWTEGERKIIKEYQPIRWAKKNILKAIASGAKGYIDEAADAAEFAHAFRVVSYGSVSIIRLLSAEPFQNSIASAAGLCLIRLRLAAAVGHPGL